MTTFTFGFYGEGIRDYGYTQKIVERELKDLLPALDIIPLALKTERQTQEEKINHIAEQAFGYNIVVIHLDADGRSRNNAYHDRFKPGYDRVQSRPDDVVNKDIIPVIPIKMTDAWMLIDFEAFTQTVSTRFTAGDLGFPNHPQQIEAIVDPKAVFESALRNARPGKRRKISPEDAYLPLAEKVNLERLRRVPAFQDFEALLIDKLKQLHFIDD